MIPCAELFKQETSHLAPSKLPGRPNIKVCNVTGICLCRSRHSVILNFCRNMGSDASALMLTWLTKAYVELFGISKRFNLLAAIFGGIDCIYAEPQKDGTGCRT